MGRAPTLHAPRPATWGWVAASVLQACAGARAPATPTCAGVEPDATSTASSAPSASPPPDPRALGELDAGERALAVAAGDCAAACAAIDEIARARATLCTPHTSACADAEQREEAARRMATPTCGPCQGAQ